MTIPWNKQLIFCLFFEMGNRKLDILLIWWNRQCSCLFHKMGKTIVYFAKWAMLWIGWNTKTLKLQAFSLRCWTHDWPIMTLSRWDGCEATKSLDLPVYLYAMFLLVPITGSKKQHLPLFTSSTILTLGNLHLPSHLCSNSWLKRQLKNAEWVRKLQHL